MSQTVAEVRRGSIRRVQVRQIICFSGALLLASPDSRAHSATLAAERLRLDVEHYASGRCTIVTVRGGNGSPRFVLDDRCHGWSNDRCGGMIFLRRVGVVEDGGTVIRPARSRPIDVPALIDSTLARRSSPMEYVHLNFLTSRCRGGAFELPFEGSWIHRGASGSTPSFRGVVIVDGNGRSSVRIASR